MGKERMEDSVRAYYAVLPADVRYDRELRPNAKLLYGELTALCNQYGYCWAPNEYFAGLYGLAPETVSRLISQPTRRNAGATLTEQRAPHIVDGSQLVGHWRRHENAPVPIVTIGVLNEGIHHEHVPKTLAHSRHLLQNIRRLDSGEHIAEKNNLPIRRRGAEARIVIGKGVLDLLEFEETRIREGEVAARAYDLAGAVPERRLVNRDAQQPVDMRAEILGNGTRGVRRQMLAH